MKKKKEIKDNAAKHSSSKGSKSFISPIRDITETGSSSVEQDIDMKINENNKHNNNSNAGIFDVNDDKDLNPTMTMKNKSKTFKDWYMPYSHKKQNKPKYTIPTPFESRELYVQQSHRNDYIDDKIQYFNDEQDANKADTNYDDTRRCNEDKERKSLRFK